jgi:hypothetical protein
MNINEIPYMENDRMSAEFWRLGSVWVDFRCEFRTSSPIWMHMSRTVRTHSGQLFRIYRHGEMYGENARGYT